MFEHKPFDPKENFVKLIKLGFSKSIKIFFIIIL